MWVNFEPGDATRYIVGHDTIRDRDLGAFPGARIGDRVFSFGTGSGPVTTWVFDSDDTHFDYYRQKMSRPVLSDTELYTLTAGWLVLTHLMGVEKRGYYKMANDIESRWDRSASEGQYTHWKQQLEPLLSR